MSGNVRELHACSAYCQRPYHASLIWTLPRDDPRSWWRLPIPSIMNEGQVVLRGIEPAPEAGPRPEHVPESMEPALVSLYFLADEIEDGTL
jgi:hypothetical protein